MPVNPSTPEEEYFAKIEYEKRRDLAAKHRASLAEDARRKLKDDHWMHCPKCGQDLITVALHAVEVDKCPSCDGMWLDAGELGQLVERDGGGALKRLLGIFAK